MVSPPYTGDAKERTDQMTTQKNSGTKYCRVCGDELTDENWNPSQQKGGDYVCKACIRKHVCLWQIKNPEKYKAQSTKASRKAGHLSMSENKECSVHYGVYINERLLKHYFNDVEVMPFGNPGYDFICNNGWKIDGKSSFTGDSGRWKFAINHNTITDYFFCVAYDNRKDKNIVHIWLLPGNKFNHLVSASISKSTIHKWAEYEQPLDKIISCCKAIKSK